MFTILFLLIPIVLYLSATFSWNYLWVLPIIFLSGWLIQRKQKIRIKTPPLYFWLIVLSCVFPVIVLIGLDIAAVYQVAHSRYFAELVLAFALLGTAVVGTGIVYLIIKLRDGLTIVRQLFAETLVMVNFYLIGVGVATVGSVEVVSRQISGLSQVSSIFAMLSILAGGMLAIYNVIIFMKSANSDV